MPSAALIGQAAGSSVSSSKWRHVRPVGLQLGPDCFPEVPEASPPASQPTAVGEGCTPRCPDLTSAGMRRALFLYGAHAGERMLHTDRRADVNATQTGGYSLANQFTAAQNLL